jgi:hypothetical protein
VTFWIRKKLTGLTGKQLALLAVVRGDWLRVGLAQRTDWPAVRRLVPAVYRAVGQEPPESVITLHSPRAGLLAAATRTATSKSKPYDVREQVDKRARWQVSSEVRSHVRAQVWASVREEVEEQIRRQVSDQIRAELRDQFPHLISNIWGVALGLHDAPWLAYYDFFSRIGFDPLALGGPLIDLARAGSGWWWAFRKVAIVTSAPYLLNRDAENRLHCEHGPALAYPDGWAIWAIHGVRVAERVVTAPLTLGIEEIAYEPNPAVRRVMLERFGYERFLQKVGLEPVHADSFGRLYRFDPQSFGSPNRSNLGYAPEPVALVEVVNATPEPDSGRRRYFLCVPPTTRTAHEAVAWTFRLRPKEYRPNVES